MQNNQYPKTCTAATYIMSNHRFDNGGEIQTKRNGQTGPKWTKMKTVQLLRARQPTEQMQQVLGKAAKIKHAIAAEIKKEDWHIKKAMQYYMEANKADNHQDEQEEGDNESYKSAMSKASSRIGWNSLIVEQRLYNDDRDAKDRLKDCITLDNGSTLSLFSNLVLVQDIRTSSKTP
jgi:hypothetical protein